MLQRKHSITWFAVLLLVLLLSACQPIQPVTESVAQAAQDEERLFFTFMVANRLDTQDSHQLVMEGHATFDPNNPEDVEGGGVFMIFDRAAEGTSKPLVDLGAGSWTAQKGLAFSSPGSYGVATAGVLDLIVELIPDEGEPVEATLRVICNVPAGSLFNQDEDGSNLPEGIFLTVADLGIYAPIVSDQPGVPTFGLTLIGPTSETRLRMKAESQ